MQENWFQLASVFDKEQIFVLATIVATRGSTYRKMGTLMLIDQQGECTGLLSGGCLEADISLHAEMVLVSKTNKLLTYDLQSDESLLWGLGLGCDGEIDILLQPLLIENNHLGFADLLRALSNNQTGHYWQDVIDGGEPHGQFILGDLNLLDQQSLEKVSFSDHGKYLVIPVFSPISILVCGAGPDAVPVIQMADQMGWQTSLWDHRANFLDQAVFEVCYEKREVRAENVHANDFIRIDLENKDVQKYDAVVVMTHNLEFDGEYLAKLVAANIGYIGLLGPGGRRDKLLAKNDLTFEDVADQVYGPVGLDLGGRSPQAIALSIMAEIQQQMSHKYSAACYRPFYFEDHS